MYVPRGPRPCDRGGKRARARGVLRLRRGSLIGSSGTWHRCQALDGTADMGWVYDRAGEGNPGLETPENPGVSGVQPWNGKGPGSGANGRCG